MSSKLFVIPALSLLYKASGIEVEAHVARLMYAGSLIILMSMWAALYHLIEYKKYQDKVYVIDKDPVTQKETKRQTTAYEYDMAELKKLINTTSIGICIVAALHYYKGFIPPLIFQSFLLPINFIDHKLFKIYVLNRPALGLNKRPFKEENAVLKWMEQINAQQNAKAEKAAKKADKKKK